LTVESHLNANTTQAKPGISVLKVGETFTKTAILNRGLNLDFTATWVPLIFTTTPTIYEKSGICPVALLSD
jgi:hypothetical protein